MMKIKDGFVVRKMADSWMAVPIGKRVSEIQGLIALSETAAVIWDILKVDHTFGEIIDILLEEYDVERNVLEESVQKFLTELQEKGILE